MNIEENLKVLVGETIKKQVGHFMVISQNEWNEAKLQTLNDIYANKLCQCSNTTFTYFVDTMAGILIVMKRITNAA